MSNIGYVHTLIFAYIEIIDKIEWREKLLRSELEMMISTVEEHDNELYSSEKWGIPIRILQGI